MANLSPRRQGRFLYVLLAAATGGILAPVPTAGAQNTSRATVRDSAPVGVGHNYIDADVAFLQGMIGHHAQALEMTALMPGRTTTASMLLLGERITVSQRDEIAMMGHWLRDRHETVPAVDTVPGQAGGQAGGHMHQMPGMQMPGMQMPGMQMPGMLSMAQMDSLKAAKGATFDRLFLRYMIQHHEGALVMVKELLATPGAAREPQLYGFVSDVDTDQRAEIRRMRSLLTAVKAP